MLNRTMLDPEEARNWGLVLDIKSNLFPRGAELIFNLALAAATLSRMPVDTLASVNGGRGRRR